jgi:hypothetical protein
MTPFKRLLEDLRVCWCFCWRYYAGIFVIVYVATLGYVLFAGWTITADGSAAYRRFILLGVLYRWSLIYVPEMFYLLLWAHIVVSVCYCIARRSTAIRYIVNWCVTAHEMVVQEQKRRVVQ